MTPTEKKAILKEGMHDYFNYLRSENGVAPDTINHQMLDLIVDCGEVQALVERLEPYRQHFSVTRVGTYRPMWFGRTRAEAEAFIEGMVLMSDMVNPDEFEIVESRSRASGFWGV
jgi:hypothetical protein